MDLDERFHTRSEEFSDDSLLLQIDAFRDKAKQLQTLISAKQRKVSSLESMVRAREQEVAEKEEQIAILQDKLSDKQRQADGLVSSVEIQVDRMLRSMRGEFDDLGRRLESAIAANPDYKPSGSDSSTRRDEPADRGYSSYDRVYDRRYDSEYDRRYGSDESRYLSAYDRKRAEGSEPFTPHVTADVDYDRIRIPLLDKMDELSRQISSLRQEITDSQHEIEDHKQEIEEQKEEIATQEQEIATRDKEIEELKKELTALINKNFDSIRDSLPAQDEEGSITLSEVKEDLSEKIHAENVKVFRNIQDTLKEMDLKEEVDLSIEVRYRSLRNRVFWTTSLLLVNVGISVVLLLLYLGVIK